MEYTLSAQEREEYDREGYVILRGIIPKEEIARLEADVRDLVERAASGDGPEVTWINREKRVPERLQRLLRPGYIRPSFVDSIERGPYLGIAEQILGAPTRYSLFGMLVGGDGKPYIQKWHRDLSPTEGEDELAILRRAHRTVTQINAPLFPDRYLAIVPRSHLRPTTPEEREVLAHNPTGDMPGGIAVESEPGDIVFYNPEMIHRGHNPGGAFRWTMHHAFMVATQPVAVHERGQESWIGEPGYLDSLPPTLRTWMRRYLDAVPEGESPSLKVLA